MVISFKMCKMVQSIQKWKEMESIVRIPEKLETIIYMNIA